MRTSLSIAALAAAVLLAACQRDADAARSQPQAASGAPVVTVWKSPSCGCCGEWVEHLQQAGFAVNVIDEPAMAAVKARHRITPALQSCHTAEVAGYVIEGHVPAPDIRRLLAEHPPVRGLAVPAMPVGSPGMEMGERFDPFEVLAFDDDGTTRVFARHDQPGW